MVADYYIYVIIHRNSKRRMKLVEMDRFFDCEAKKKTDAQIWRIFSEPITRVVHVVDYDGLTTDQVICDYRKKLAQELAIGKLAFQAHIALTTKGHYRRYIREEREFSKFMGGVLSATGS